MKKCPYCRTDLLDDSFYCDHCGKELKICLDCHAFVAGKFCTNCSSRNIVLAKDFVAATEQTEQRNIPESTNEPTANETAANENIDISQPSFNHIDPTYHDAEANHSSTCIKLKGINHHVVLELYKEKGSYIFGRSTGEFSEFFNSIRFISRRHAEMSFDKERKRWMLTDMGSSNGTFVNGKKLLPMTPVQVNIGDMIQIAFAKFTLE